MSKRPFYPLNKFQSTKRPKSIQTPFNILTIPKDEFLHIISFLNIGEIIMFSLSCKLINNVLNEHFQILHPYFLIDDFSSYDASEYDFDENDEKYSSSDEIKNSWSISRAFKTHECLRVNGKTIEKVNEILDKLIENKEQFGFKLSRFVYVNEEEIDEECFAERLIKLFSKSINESKEDEKFVTLSFKSKGKVEESKPISVRKLLQIPIGYLVKDLTIDFKIQIPELYNILSNFANLERLYIKLETQEEYQENFSTHFPLLENLKFLILSLNSPYTDNIVGDILSVSPNLEYLTIYNSGNLNIFFLLTMRAYINY